jgi:hypothetical protein
LGYRAPPRRVQKNRFEWEPAAPVSCIFYLVSTHHFGSSFLFCKFFYRIGFEQPESSSALSILPLPLLSITWTHISEYLLLLAVMVFFLLTISVLPLLASVRKSGGRHCLMTFLLLFRWSPSCASPSSHLPYSCFLIFFLTALKRFRKSLRSSASISNFTSSVCCSDCAALNTYICSEAVIPFDQSSSSSVTRSWNH